MPRCAHAAWGPCTGVPRGGVPRGGRPPWSDLLTIRHPVVLGCVGAGGGRAVRQGAAAARGRVGGRGAPVGGCR